MAAIIYWLSIALALLNYGAADLVTIALLCLPIFLMLPLIVIVHGVSEHTRFAVAIGLLALILPLAWIWFQTAHLPGAFRAHPSWQDIQQFAPEAGATISVTPADDWASALRLAIPFGVFLAGLQLFRTDEKALAAMKLLAVAGSIVAGLAVFQFLVLPKTLLFGEKRFYLDSLTGFFVNRNTAGTFFGMVTLLVYAFFCRAAAGIEARRVITAIEQRRQIADDQKRQLWLTLLYGILLLTSVLALMLTKSRAGVGSSIAALILLTLLMGLRPKQQGRGSGFSSAKTSSFWRRGFTMTLIVLGVAFVLLSLAGRALLRAEVQGAEDGRFCVTPGIFAAVRDHLPWGAGLASFQELFPAYRDPQCGISSVWDRAHNVYAEGFLTLGMLLPIILAVVVVYAVSVFLKGLRNRRQLRFAGEIGLASLLLLSIHSAFDFSLQISGFAIFYAAMLSPIVTICLRPPGGAKPGTRRKRTRQEESVKSYPGSDAAFQ